MFLFRLLVIFLVFIEKIERIQFKFKMKMSHLGLKLMIITTVGVPFSTFAYQLFHLWFVNVQCFNG